MTFLYLLDLCGTAAFAISGAMSAINRKMDLLGVLIIGTVTAIGGGTIRDCLIGATPVGWMIDEHYIYAVLSGIILTIVFKKRVYKLKQTLFLFDTIGIGVFTVIGVNKSLSVGIPIPGAIVMGMTSAVVGGVIRDVLCNDIPLILHKDIYATCCIIGASLYVAIDMLGVNTSINMTICSLTIIVIRLLVVRYNLSMPIISMKESDKI